MQASEAELAEFGANVLVLETELLEDFVQLLKDLLEECNPPEDGAFTHPIYVWGNQCLHTTVNTSPGEPAVGNTSPAGRWGPSAQSTTAAPRMAPPKPCETTKKS